MRLNAIEAQSQCAHSVDAAGGERIDPAQVRVALLTHAHWDHTGALRDLPNASVRMSRAEYWDIAPLDGDLAGGVMPRHFEGA